MNSVELLKSASIGASIEGSQYDLKFTSGLGAGLGNMGYLKICDLFGSKQEEEGTVQRRRRKEVLFVFHINLCWSVFLLAQTGTYLRRGTSIDKMPPSDWHIDKSIVNFLGL